MHEIPEIAKERLETLDLCDGGILVLVLTELYGGEVLAYDSVTDAVFQVDF